MRFTAHYFRACFWYFFLLTLGPPFTHLKQSPYRAIYYGQDSPKNNPEFYIAAISELMHVYKNELSVNVDKVNGRVSGIPLVVNTHGWVKGLHSYN